MFSQEKMGRKRCPFQIGDLGSIQTGWKKFCTAKSDAVSMVFSPPFILMRDCQKAPARMPVENRKAVLTGTFSCLLDLAAICAVSDPSAIGFAQNQRGRPDSDFPWEFL